MLILGINGIRSNNTNPVWKTVGPAFKREFPGSTFEIEGEDRVGLMEIRRMKRLIVSLERKYDDGRELLLVGHSMGGVIACALERRLERSRVLGIVTICSPITYFFGICPLVLDARHTLKAPIISVRGKSDKFVRWGTKHWQSVKHIELPCDHFIELSRRRDLAQEIATAAREALF